MRHSEAPSQQLEDIGKLLPNHPIWLSGLATGVWLLTLGLLIIGLYLEPTITSVAMAAVGLGIPLFWLVLCRPEFGLLLLIFVTASFISPGVVEVRLPFGGMDLRDVALVGMFGILLLRGLIHKRVEMPLWSFSASLLILLGFASFSLLYALLYHRVAPNWAFSELRPLAFYAVFFIAAWSIWKPEQLKVALVGLFILADLTGAVIILQQFLGLDNYLLGSMEESWRVWRAGDTAGQFGTVRIIPPGHVLMFVMMLVAFCLMVYHRQSRALRIIFALQFVYLNFSLLFTYTRAQWIAAAIGFILISVLLPAKDRSQIVRYGLGVLCALLLIYGLFGAQIRSAMVGVSFVDALAERAYSLFTPQETLESHSLQWRVFENEKALQSISEHPILGVGLGNSYRDVTLLQGEASRMKLRFTMYVHNAYLYIATKMGIAGLLAFLFFCAAYISNCWRAYSKVLTGQNKRIALAVLASFVGIMVWSITQPHLLQTQSTAVVGCMIGLIAGMYRMQSTNADR